LSKNNIVRSHLVPKSFKLFDRKLVVERMSGNMLLDFNRTNQQIMNSVF